ATQQFRIALHQGVEELYHHCAGALVGISPGQIDLCPGEVQFALVGLPPCLPGSPALLPPLRAFGRRGRDGAPASPLRRSDASRAISAGPSLKRASSTGTARLSRPASSPCAPRSRTFASASVFSSPRTLSFSASGPECPSTRAAA